MKHNKWCQNTPSNNCTTSTAVGTKYTWSILFLFLSVSVNLYDSTKLTLDTKSWLKNWNEYLVSNYWITDHLFKCRRLKTKLASCFLYCTYLVQMHCTSISKTTLRKMEYDWTLPPPTHPCNTQYVHPILKDTTVVKRACWCNWDGWAQLSETMFYLHMKHQLLTKPDTFHFQSSKCFLLSPPGVNRVQCITVLWYESVSYQFHNHILRLHVFHFALRLQFNLLSLRCFHINGKWWCVCCLSPWGKACPCSLIHFI